MQTSRIIFFSTPEFGVPTLKALHESEFDIVLVVTQPDRKKGRGRKTIAPPVKEKAFEYGYDLFQPESVKTRETFDYLSSYHPDFFVVVAYGHVLPRKVLDIPKKAAVNIHGSLLPKYRGPAPIHRAVINGEKETGITTMLMEEGLDTGDMLLSAETAITDEDTTETLHDRLAKIGADLLIETLRKWNDGKIHPTPQDEAKATYAPMLKKEEGLIDWTLPAENLGRFIRGMTPWPGAYSFLEGKRFKIWMAKPEPTITSANDTLNITPGTVLEGYQDEIRIRTGFGDLVIEEIQAEGGKRLKIRDFLKGRSIFPGVCFGGHGEIA